MLKQAVALITASTIMRIVLNHQIYNYLCKKFDNLTIYKKVKVYFHLSVYLGKVKYNVCICYFVFIAKTKIQTFE